VDDIKILRVPLDRSMVAAGQQARRLKLKPLQHMGSKGVNQGTIYILPQSQAPACRQRERPVDGAWPQKLAELAAANCDPRVRAARMQGRLLFCAAKRVNRNASRIQREE
jgi:hypothetical protein